VDWDLRLEPVVSGLALPSALVFFGPREDEEFLVLEEDTGKVRHFKQRVDQGDALDLEVDSCGERGLVGIALHPSFDPAPTPVTDPPTERPPSQDWVYLSYHPRGSDGCDLLPTVLRVERYVWNGTALVLDVVIFEKGGVDAITAVGGTIATSLDINLATFVPRLFVAIGSPERDGIPRTTSSPGWSISTRAPGILRLDQNGKTPGDNPFDHDLDGIDAEDRYFAYGLRDPRGLAVDPFSDPKDRQLWFTEWSDLLNSMRSAALRWDQWRAGSDRQGLQHRPAVTCGSRVDGDGVLSRPT
jgi:hypothetical protein